MNSSIRKENRERRCIIGARQREKIIVKEQAVQLAVSKVLNAAPVMETAFITHVACRFQALSCRDLCVGGR